MKSRGLIGAIAAAMMCLPQALLATPVAWLFQGQLEYTAGNLPPGIAVGDPFSFVLHFDTNTPVTNPVVCGTGGVGTRCNHNGDPTMLFTDIHLGSFLLPHFGDDPNASIDRTIIVRNNVLDPGGSGDIVDGYTFGIRETLPNGENDNFSILMRGPEDLNVVTDGRVLPGDVPPGLLGLRLSDFQICSSRSEFDCFYGEVDGGFTSISRVPEPATIALVGLGLAGLGFSRRKQK